ncbi:MAG: hypothetical protein PHP82_03365 [Candidatus ainarchaeum sp.]|nr:hypothetical protein [Candidatus ainarchaeum sp.]
MNSSIHNDILLRERRINSLNKDIIEITRIFSKEGQSQNAANFQRRINEKKELVNILIKQNTLNKK